jgi:hypothetical protein
MTEPFGALIRVLIQLSQMQGFSDQGFNDQGFTISD